MKMWNSLKIYRESARTVEAKGSAPCPNFEPTGAGTSRSTAPMLLS